MFNNVQQLTQVSSISIPSHVSTYGISLSQDSANLSRCIPLQLFAGGFSVQEVEPVCSHLGAPWMWATKLTTKEASQVIQAYLQDEHAALARLLLYKTKRNKLGWISSR